MYFLLKMGIFQPAMLVYNVVNVQFALIEVCSSKFPHKFVHLGRTNFSKFAHFGGGEISPYFFFVMNQKKTKKT